MKNTQQNLFYIFILIFISCVKTDDFDIPNIESEEPIITSNTTIKAVKNSFNQSNEKVYTFPANDDSIIEAYIISSDEAGNFYKNISIQDNYENPTAGIELLIDMKDYYTKFNFGTKVYIKMSGLSIDNNNGKYRIGYLSKNSIEEIPEPLINDFIIRSTESSKIQPKQISIADFNNEIIGTYIQLQNIQFKNNEIGKTIAGESNDKFTSERVLIQCDNRLTTILSTSTYSNFKSNLLSDKKGSISGVLTKDYYSEKFVLVINDPSTINFSESDRCDPDFLFCTGNLNNEKELIFFENFQEINKTNDLEDLGWTNENIYLGNEKFNKRSSQGNVSMQISAYNTGENPMEVWLITPPINLDNSSNEILSFETKATYDNGTILTAWVSSDFNDNITEATWQQLDVKVSVGPGNSYVNDYTLSGELSLDCLEGDVFIAIKYLGGDPGVSTTYDIDNIKITGD